MHRSFVRTPGHRHGIADGPNVIYSALDDLALRISQAIHLKASSIEAQKKMACCMLKVQMKQGAP